MERMVDWIVIATIAAPIIALFVGGAINRAYEGRPRVLTYLGHASAFTLNRGQSDELIIHTHSVIVRNAGRKPAKNVRLGHNKLPDFEIVPSILYNVKNLTQGGTEIVFPILVAGEQVTISYLYFPPLTWHGVNTHTKSDEGFAKVIKVLPTPQLSKWSKGILYFLLLVGLTSITYVLFVGVQWVLDYFS